MTVADLDRVIEALADVHRNINEDPDYGVGVDPEAISDALALLRGMREGATEVHAWRFGGAWHAGEHYRGATGDIDVSPALLIISPEDG